MSGFESSTATVRFFGDDLEPDEITARLGCSPTRSFRKGEISVGRKTGKETEAKTGGWLLSANDREPADLDLQINELLDQLSDHQSVWTELTQRYQGDLFCGLFMSTSNDGLRLSAETLRALSERGLKLTLDVYDPSD